jgi:ribosomal-protein-alanine N-acetyltransferase
VTTIPCEEARHERYEDTGHPMTSAPRPTVSLRRLEPEDRRPYLAAVARSVSLHHPWACPPDTQEAFDAYLAGSADRIPLAVVVDNGELAGVYTLSQIHYGAFRNAYLGYYAFWPYAGMGAMRTAMPLLFRYAFGDLGLHRLQANVQPGNHRSIGLLRVTGWREEGYARRYLKIGGRWRDHLMFAILAEEVGEGSRQRSP